MGRYAESTEVPSDRSRAEIERTLRRYGATGFMYGWQERRALVAFEMAGRRVRFELPLPDQGSREFTHTAAKGLRRSATAAAEAYEQAVRQRWRALALAIKAKLEAVESGIATFEDEFLAYVILPDGQSVGRWLRPQIEGAYRDGRMPPMLPAPKS